MKIPNVKNMTTKEVVEELRRTLSKLVNNFNGETLADAIILQKDINTLISTVVYDSMVNIDEQEQPEKPEKPEETSTEIVEIFHKALEEYADTDKATAKENPFVYPTPFDDLSMDVVPEVVEVAHIVPSVPLKETDTTENDSIFIIDIYGTKFVVTEYQYKKKHYEWKIEEVLNISDWTNRNSVYLNKYSDLRDRLIMDQLPYEEFLYLEGWEDTESTPFDNVDGKLLIDVQTGEFLPVVEEVQEHDPIQTTKEILVRYDIVNFMAEEDPAPKSVDNWVPEVVHVKPQRSLTPTKAEDTIIDVTIEEEEPKPVFNLTPHQQLKYDGLVGAVEEIINKQRSLVRPPNAAYYMAVLEGAAGTGKTTMMKKVLETLLDKGYSIIFCSPTHQALGVIRETLMGSHLEFTEDNSEFLMNDYRLIIKTLASFLGIKMKRDLENGTESFETDPKAAILTCDILAIDESSMVSKDQLRILLQKLHINVRCILFIGDEVQLDSPSDNNESNGIFTLPQKYSLEEVVRQAADSKILPLAWEIRGYILNKYCPYLPSQLLHPGRTNENIIIIKDQTLFIDHYMKNPSDSKLISTYTNKITNEYNTYIRHLRLIGTGIPLDINIDGNGKNICTDSSEYRELYVGEELVVLEPNQRNGDVIHQTGERIKIATLTEKEKSVLVMVDNYNDLLSEPSMQEYVIHYWEVMDTKGKRLSIVKEEDKELYNTLLANLSVEAKKATHKHKWAKYWTVKEKFVKVNKTYAFTLHKLQGSTCDDIYVDARDLDKFWQRMPIGVYKLLYIALTRPKNNFIVLI